MDTYRSVYSVSVTDPMNAASYMQVPVALMFGPDYKGADLRLLRNLLDAPNLHPSVYGTPVMRAIILFRYVSVVQVQGCE